MATVEHHPGLHIPKKIALAGAAALTAVAGFFGARAISELSPQQLRSVPSASDQLPPQDIPIAISDPPKIIPQTPESQAPALEPPKLSPLEQAIRAGRIEISTLPANSVKPLSPNEAEKLLNVANQKAGIDADFRLILPLNVRSTPNLVLETLTYRVPKGETRVIGLKNIPTGETFSSPFSGEAKYLHGAAGGGTLAIAFEIKIDGTNSTVVIMARREGSKSFLPPQKPTKINIGDPLFIMGTEEPLGFYKGSQQVVIQFNHQAAGIWDGQVSNLLLEDGELVFLGSAGN